MYCQHCGSSVDSAWKFCKSCGGPLQAESPSRKVKTSTSKVGKTAKAPYDLEQVGKYLEELDLVIWRRDLYKPAENPHIGSYNSNPYLYVNTEELVREDELELHEGEPCIFCKGASGSRKKSENNGWGVVDDGNKTLGNTCLLCLVARLIEEDEVWSYFSRSSGDQSLAGLGEVLILTERFGGWRHAQRASSESGESCWICQESVRGVPVASLWDMEWGPIHDSCLDESSLGIASLCTSFKAHIGSFGRRS